MKYWGIQSRFLVALGLVALLPVLVVLLLIFFQLSADIKSQTGEHYEEIAVEIAARIEASLTNEEIKLSSLSLAPLVQETLSQETPPSDSGEGISKFNTLNNYLELFLRKNALNYRRLILYNRDLKPVMQVPKLEFPPPQIDSKMKTALKTGNVLFSLVEKDPKVKLHSPLVLYLFVPVQDPEKHLFQGVLCAGINFHFLIDFIKNSEHARTGRIFIATNQRNILYSTVPYIHQIRSAFFDQPESKLSHPGWNIITTKRGYRYIQSHAPIRFEQANRYNTNKEESFYLVAEKSLSSVLSPIYSFIGTTGSLCLLIMGISFLIGMRATGGVIRSIRRLQVSAKAVGLGRLDKKIKIKRHDEIGELASSFNQMIQNLKQALEENEQKSRALAHVNEELKKQNEIKGHFLSTVSHELRTPLTTLAGYIRFLKDEKSGPLNREQYDSLALADKQIQQISYLLEQLLSQVKYESGKIRSNVSPVYMQGVIQDCILGLQEKVHAKEITVENHLNQNLPLVYGDRNQLIQIATNLLENAVKYTPLKGKIIINAREQEEFIEFSIKDTGRGIPEELQDKVFEKFFRVSKKAEALEHGFGLGLSIVKDLVEANGGRIWLTSKLNEGTEFFFILPKYRA